MSAPVAEKLAQDLQNIRDDLREGLDSLLDGVTPPAAAQQALDSLADARDRVADSNVVETLQKQAGVAADRLQQVGEEAEERARQLGVRGVAIGIGAVAIGAAVAVLLVRRSRKKRDPHSARLE